MYNFEERLLNPLSFGRVYSVVYNIEKSDYTYEVLPSQARSRAFYRKFFLRKLESNELLVY